MNQEDAGNVLLSVANALRERESRRKHTPQTDKELMSLYRSMGSKWREISKRLGGTMQGFSDDVCRNRVLRILKNAGETYVPVLNRHSPTPVAADLPLAPKAPYRGKWTEEDDAVLFRLVTTDEMKWTEVVKAFPTRTKQAIRNRSQRVLRVLREEASGDADALIKVLRSQATMKRDVCNGKRRKHRTSKMGPKMVLARPLSTPSSSSSSSSSRSCQDEYEDDAMTTSSSFWNEVELDRLPMPSASSQCEDQLGFDLEFEPWKDKDE